MNWSCEGGGPGALSRRGWKKGDLKIGDTLIVDGYLAKDGSHLVDARRVTFPDGRSVYGGTRVTAVRATVRPQQIRPTLSFIFDICQRLYDLPMSDALRESDWAFPIVETIHVLAITVMVGVIAIVDLRLLGVILPGEPVKVVSDRLLPITWVGFAILVVSGAVLFCSEAVKLYYNPAFRNKGAADPPGGTKRPRFPRHNLPESGRLDFDSYAHWGAGRGGAVSPFVVRRHHLWADDRLLPQRAVHMTLLPLFQWFGQTPPALYMRKSTWGFAITETIHLLGLATIGGIIIVLGLSALGCGLGRERFPRLVRSLTPVFWTSLTVMIVTGSLLVASKPVRYYLDNIFRAKMLFLALGITAFVLLRRRWIAETPGTPQTWSTRTYAGVFMALWLGVALAGRFIGFL